MKMLSSELDKVKKERAELETQVRQLSTKLQDPSNGSDTLRAKLASSEQLVAKLQKEVDEMRARTAKEMAAGCSKCRQVYAS